MKRWPLRWKIALYAAGLGVIATIAGACTTWAIMHYWELGRFDRRLTTDAQELLRMVATFEAGPAKNRLPFTETSVPLSLRSRFIQVSAPDGRIIYLSPNMPGPAQDDGIEAIHSRTIDHHRARVGIFHQDGFTACVGADTAETNQIGRDIVLGMLGAIPTVLLVVALGGRWVAGRALGPVEALRKAAARITPRDLGKRLPVPPANDEIAGLVSVLNQAFDRLQRSFEQSMRFSAEASHHLKTPLCVLRAGIEEILTDKNTAAEQQERAAALLHQVHELTSIAENLLLLARADAGGLELQKERFDLKELLDGVCDDASAMAESREIRVEAQVPEHLSLVGDRPATALIVQNLVENAIKYNACGGAIRIYAQSHNGKVELKVMNNGTSIPAERAPHIFERFCRARPDERIAGSGLGLSIACELAKAQGGELALVRSDEEWTEFRLTLPNHHQAK